MSQAAGGERGLGGPGGGQGPVSEAGNDRLPGGEVAGEALPLCVDLDGTLVATDTLWEGIIALIRKQPQLLLALPFWLIGGRARFKAELVRRARADATALPYREELLDYLRDARAAGRAVLLVTASRQEVAHAVADHLGLFSGVMASESGFNLKGPRKAEALVAAFGEGGFEYVGDAAADRPVFARAGAASTVGAEGARAAARSGTPVARSFEAPPADAATWRRGLRMHQWVKNVLLFLPLLASHRFTEAALWGQALVAFVSLSLCASTVYLFNDLMDLEADRRHPTKRRRPLAAGRIPIPHALAAVPVLLGVAFGLSLALLPPLFSGCLLAYLLLNGLYTFWLKRVAIADVVFLACLYSLRVLAGGFALAIFVSPWLIGFSLFFFLNLAFLKRYADLRLVARSKGTGSPGRDYQVDDAPLLLALGPAAGMMATVVLALYVQGDHVATLYARPEVLWGLVPIMVYWTSRFWLLAHRGQMTDDPVLFATRDPVSYAAAALGVAVLALGALLG